MKESPIERSLVRKGKAAGIEFLKFKTPSRRDVPDRIAFLSTGLTVFVECKRPGEELRKRQDMYRAELQAKGFVVFVLDNLRDAIVVINEILRLSERSN